ncbi:MAG: nucleoside monophosphate kinase [Candidatus Parcubacteria bacterium]|nr:nucleoside monophosphate kinase [Candidatus Paceibacterota bacterium]
MTQTNIQDTNLENYDNFPDVIIFFGPPASGKGTQARLLSEKLPNYVHLDFGGQLREFVKLTLGSYPELSEIRKKSFRQSQDENIEIALSLRESMIKGQPVKSEYLWKIVSKTIDKAIIDGKKLILEGIGRTYEDGRKFGKLAFDNKLTVCIFHIYISPEQSVSRANQRYYAPGSSHPHGNYNQALLECKNKDLPYQRPEDTDSEVVMDRYNKVYANIFAKVISTMQIESKGRLFIIDGQDSVSDVYKHIWKYLQIYYNSISIFK